MARKSKDRYGEQLSLFPVTPRDSKPDPVVYGLCIECSAPRMSKQIITEFDSYLVLVCSENERHGPDHVVD